MLGASFRAGRLPSILLMAVLSPAPMLTSCGADFCFVSSFPAQITTFSPGTVFAGGAQFRLTIRGNNFGTNTFVILPDGTELRPVFIDGSRLIVVIPANQILTPGTLIIRVTDPCGRFSDAFTIPVIAGSV